jgi:hypothetical protein
MRPDNYKAVKEHQEMVKRAKAAALAWLNENRKQVGQPPLTRLETIWWSLYGAEWIAKEVQKIREGK